MCNSKEAKLATISPHVFLPILFGVCAVIILILKITITNIMTSTIMVVIFHSSTISIFYYCYCSRLHCDCRSTTVKTIETRL